MQRIYLDANGQSPPLSEAKAKLGQIAELCGNPSSFHKDGRIMRAIIDEARELVARGLNAKAKQVIFTSGASEANRLFVDALIEQGRLLAKKPSVLTSFFEHPSLLKPLMQAHSLGQIALEVMEADTAGALAVSEEKLASADVLVVCQAHNETGIIPDIHDLLLHVRPDAIFMSDVSQAYARLAPLSERVDVMTFSAQKMGGYPGVGGMVLRGNGKNLPAPWPGGGQERGFRPGTESALLIAAFGAAAAVVQKQRELQKNLAELRDYFETSLEKQFPLRIIGKPWPRLPNTSAICFFDQDPDALRIGCDMAGLSVGFGAACSGLAPEGSFALKRLGLTLHEEKSTIRFSFPSTITRAHIDDTLHRLIKYVLNPN